MLAAAAALALSASSAFAKDAPDDHGAMRRFQTAMSVQAYLDMHGIAPQEFLTARIAPLAPAAPTEDLAPNPWVNWNSWGGGG